nr:hypothetical protein CFP56_37054 [Quercus suber]
MVNPPPNIPLLRPYPGSHLSTDFAPPPPNPYLPSHPVSPAPEHLDTTSVALIVLATLLSFAFAIAWVAWSTCGAAARAEGVERREERRTLLGEKGMRASGWGRGPNGGRENDEDDDDARSRREGRSGRDDGNDDHGSMREEEQSRMAGIILPTHSYCDQGMFDHHFRRDHRSLPQLSWSVETYRVWTYQTLLSTDKRNADVCTTSFVTRHFRNSPPRRRRYQQLAMDTVQQNVVGAEKVYGSRNEVYACMTINLILSSTKSPITYRLI